MTESSGVSQEQLLEVDVVVVGLGPGGEATANKLAKAGLSVVGVEKGLVGGECPYYGCVPSKMAIRAGNALAEARRVPALAGDSTTEADWIPVAKRIREEATDDWDDTVAVRRLEDHGARLLRGSGRLVGDREVDVDGRRVRARKAVVLNTGTDPGAPPIPGLEGTPYWTNRDVVKITELPTSLAVIGGGAIGCELAQAFRRFGVEVTLLEAADRIMTGEEPETSELMTEVFAAEGVRVLAGAAIEEVSHDGGQFRLTVADEVVSAERLLVAAGRVPQIGNIGLDSVGVDPDTKHLATDGRMRVLAGDEPLDWLFAVGDIVGQGAYTHTSMYQAAVVVRHLSGQPGAEAVFHAVPRVTFTDPEVGSVGLTEAQARDQGLDVRTGSAAIADSSRGWMHHVGNEGLIKLVADGEVLVGATSVGPMGGEVLGLLTTAVHARIPVMTLKTMIYPYPTFTGAVRDALSAL
jgi:pyruvate/2-oxoglutarate dehydrogenase complex dihydrolipoamide dehydrogenase (E3) component